MRLRATSDRRQGLVLISVLMVIVILSLAAYEYSEWMLAEYRAVDSGTRAAQARALAESGVSYTAALLASGGDVLNGNPFDNSDAFDHIEVPTTSKRGKPGWFSVLTLR